MAEGNSSRSDKNDGKEDKPQDANLTFGADVPISPPHTISVDDMLKMKAEVENMILTHEAALEENFRLEKNVTDAGSLQGRVRAIMEKAFWDILEEQLNEDPPNYNQAFVLFQEIKQELLELLPPNRHSVKDMIEEVLDVDLIKQKLEHSVFDLGLYAKFVVDIMGKLCAPVRDEDIERLRNVVEVVPLYREIFRVLELMKLDLANFTLSYMRPYLKQHSVDIERKKFFEILRIQQENGVDGLQNTKMWLASSLSNLLMRRSLGNPSSSDGTKQTTSESMEGVTPSSVLNEAYLRLLITNSDNSSVAETLLVDFHRLCDLRNNFGLLVLVTSILAMSTSAVGQLDEDFKKKLKLQIFTLTKDVHPREHKDRSLAVCDQVVKELNGWLNEKKVSVMTQETEKLLRDQTMNILDPNVTGANPVCKLMGERLCHFLSQIISNSALKNIDTPKGFASLSDELKQFGGQFTNIISHNRAVFGGVYDGIIEDLMKRRMGAPEDDQGLTSKAP